MRVIADLDRENLARPQVPERAILVASAQHLDFARSGRRTRRFVSKIAGASRRRTAVSAHAASSNGSSVFITCGISAFAATFPALFPL